MGRSSGITESVVSIQSGRGLLLAALMIILSAGRGAFAAAESWNMVDGSAFEAELVNVFSDEVVFRITNRKIIRVKLAALSDESRVRIELAQPPRLAFDFIKSYDTKIFPIGLNEWTQRPAEKRCHYGIRIKQTSAGDYNHRLDLELFVIGRERLGNRFILLDRETSSFFLTRDNKREFEFRSHREVVLRNFNVGKVVRGETYYGYLAVVTDGRGEKIAVSNSHDWLYEHLEILRERDINQFMDKTCSRVFPTRPPPYAWYQ